MRSKLSILMLSALLAGCSMQASPEEVSRVQEITLNAMDGRLGVVPSDIVTVIYPWNANCEVEVFITKTLGAHRQIATSFRVAIAGPAKYEYIRMKAQRASIILNRQLNEGGIAEIGIKEARP